MRRIVASTSSRWLGGADGKFAFCWFLLESLACSSVFSPALCRQLRELLLLFILPSSRIIEQQEEQQSQEGNLLRVKYYSSVIRECSCCYRWNVHVDTCWSIANFSYVRNSPFHFFMRLYFVLQFVQWNQLPQNQLRFSSLKINGSINRMKWFRNSTESLWTVFCSLCWKSTESTIKIGRSQIGLLRIEKRNNFFCFFSLFRNYLLSP